MTIHIRKYLQALVAIVGTLVFNVGANAQVVVEEESAELTEEYVSSHAASLAAKVFKEWCHKNPDLSDAQINQVYMFADTTYVTRYMATSYDGKSLALAVSKDPISYLEITFNGVILGSIRYDEGGKSLIVAHKTPNVLTAGEEDADATDVAFRKMVKELKPFAIIGIDRTEDLFFFKSSELHYVNTQSLERNRVDVAGLLPSVFEDANRRHTGGVLFSIMGGGAVCAFLLAIMLS